MDEYMEKAFEIACGQARVRPMTSGEVAQFIKDMAADLRKVDDAEALSSVTPEQARRSIGKTAISCLVCGEEFKMLTKHHLSLHGLTPDEYRQKFGLPPKATLACRDLQEFRRKKMNEMRLWEKAKS